MSIGFSPLWQNTRRLKGLVWIRVWVRTTVWLYCYWPMVTEYTTGQMHVEGGLLSSCLLGGKGEQGLGRDHSILRLYLRRRSCCILEEVMVAWTRQVLCVFNPCGRSGEGILDAVCVWWGIHLLSWAVLHFEPIPFMYFSLSCSWGTGRSYSSFSNPWSKPAICSLVVFVGVFFFFLKWWVHFQNENALSQFKSSYRWTKRLVPCYSVVVYPPRPKLKE